MRIVEIRSGAPTDQFGRIRVHRRDLRAPEDYEARFDELMNAGLPWLNVSAYGVDESALIVAIEIPIATSNRESRTSVNFSGPVAKVIGQGWKADQVLSIE